MCGRFTLFAEWASLLAHFGITAPPAWEWHARYNIAPSQQVPTVFQSGQVRSMRLMQWGMTAVHASPDGARLVINARAETVASKPMFCQAFQARRCLVPANGFYEWLTTAAGKQPMFIHPPTETLLAFAAIWQAATRQETQDSVVLLTTDANPSVRPIHDRMPLILAPQHYQAWLTEASGSELVKSLLAPYAGPLASHPVTSAVNATQQDDATLTQPISSERRGEQMTLW